MGTHPIDELMKTAMESIRDMVDVNTIVGDAVQTADDTVIIPVSRVAFGFAAGGGDYQGQRDRKTEQNENFPLPEEAEPVLQFIRLLLWLLVKTT